MNNRRNNWIKRVSNNFYEAEKEHPREIGCIVINSHVVIMDIKTEKMAISSCNPKDEFDLDTGIAIAWARLNEYKVPDYVINKEPEKVKINNIEIGKRFKYEDQIYKVKGKDNYGELVTFNETKNYYEIFSLDYHIIKVIPID